MRTIVKVNIEHIEYSTRGVYIYESQNIAIRNRNITEFRSGTQESDVYSKGKQGMLCQNME